MKLDKYKQAISDEYINSNKNIFVNASAGTGKTTLLLRLLEVTPSYKDCLFLAFNRSIVEELEKRVMGRAEVKTIHSKAFSTLLKNVRVRFKISKWRDYSICMKNVYSAESYHDKKRLNGRILNLSRIYNLLRVNLIDVNDRDAIEAACLRWDIEFDESYYQELKIFVDSIEAEQKKLHINALDIDFTDQLYLAYRYVPAELFPKYDVVFCDEGQDLNQLQRELILRMVKPNGRLIIVGDYSQAIYGFQGSSPDSFKKFEQSPNTVALPLNVTYRCAKNIVEIAKRYSDNIEAADGANEGIVRYGTLDEVNPGDYVLCRNNLPLVSAFVYFLKENKKALILGKDFGASLQLLLEKIECIGDLATILDEKQKELNARGIKNAKNNDSFIALMEKVMILRLLFQELPDLTAIKNILDTMFSDDEQSDHILLSTIHKSKGLEADRVFILGFHELIPSKYARTELALYGERCLQFVAVTRAREELVFINYKEINEDEEAEIIHRSGDAE